MPVVAVTSHARRGLGFWACFLPPFTWMAVLYFAPLAVLLSYSVLTHDYIHVKPELTFENYEAVFSKSYRSPLIRTVMTATCVTLIDMVLAFPVAYFLVFHAGRLKGLLTLLILLPLWSSYLVRVFAWRIILATRGPLNDVLVRIGILDQPSPNFLYNSFSVGLTLCYIWLPFMVLPLVTAFERLPRNLLDASADLGGGALVTFRRVVFPLVMPGLLAGGLSVFSLTAGDYITPALIGGPGNGMIGNAISEQFGAASNWPLGAAMSAVVLIVVFALLAFLSRRGVLETL